MSSSNEVRVSSTNGLHLQRPRVPSRLRWKRADPADDADAGAGAGRRTSEHNNHRAGSKVAPSERL